MKIKTFVVTLCLLVVASTAQALTAVDYEKWADRTSPIAGLSQDCYSTEFSTGDLISTLIVWEYKTEYTFQSPKIYTPEYLMNLDKIVVGWLKKYWIKWVFASYICNRADWVDIIVDKRINRLIIRNKNSVFLLPSKVQTTINSPTGWGHSYCKSEKYWNTLLWNCSVDYSSLENWSNILLKYKINLRTGKYLVDER